MKIQKYSLIMLLVLLTSWTNESDCDNLRQVKITSIDWDIQFEHSVSPQRLLKMPKAYKKTINGKTKLSQICERIKRVSTCDTVHKSEDYRLTCLLYYKDRRKVDTLSFGALQTMTINSIHYPLDTILLKRVVIELPIRQQQIIEDSFFKILRNFEWYQNLDKN